MPVDELCAELLNEKSSQCHMLQLQLQESQEELAITRQQLDGE